MLVRLVNKMNRSTFSKKVNHAGSLVVWENWTGSPFKESESRLFTSFQKWTGPFSLKGGPVQFIQIKSEPVSLHSSRKSESAWFTFLESEPVHFLEKMNQRGSQS